MTPFTLLLLPQGHFEDGRAESSVTQVSRELKSSVETRLSRGASHFSEAVEVEGFKPGWGSCSWVHWVEPEKMAAWLEDPGEVIIANAPVRIH